MRSFKLLERRARYILAAIGLLSLGVVAPFASAAQITQRSVALSSSTKSATGVSYAFTFTATQTGGAVVAQFCSNTPLVGQDCTAPTGFTSAGATASGGATISGTPTANKVIVAKTVAASSNTFTLGNITNPSSAGSLYVRIVTYEDTSDAGSYSANGQTLGSAEDQGSVALSITDNIGVTGDVLETMTFCVSKTVDILKGCTGSLDAPTLEIGELNGAVRALSSGAISTVDVLTQISTNAVGGAVVSLKSNTTTCGGLSRVGAASFAAGCGVPAQASMSGDIAQGTAGIGIKGATATSETANGGVATGDYALETDYSTSAYRMRYASDNSSGVTSTYGDPILNTAGAPASNKEMTLTFGATISPNTPAGRYTANYSLIATGTF